MYLLVYSIFLAAVSVIRFMLLQKTVNETPVSGLLKCLGIVSVTVLMLYYVVVTVVATLLLR